MSARRPSLRARKAQRRRDEALGAFTVGLGFAFLSLTVAAMAVRLSELVQ